MRIEPPCLPRTFSNAFTRPRKSCTSSRCRDGLVTLFLESKTWRPLWIDARLGSLAGPGLSHPSAFAAARHSPTDAQYTQSSGFFDLTHCPQGISRSHFSLRRLQMEQESGGLRRLGGSVVDMAAVVTVSITEQQQQLVSVNPYQCTRFNATASQPWSSLSRKKSSRKSMFFSVLDGGTRCRRRYRNFSNGKLTPNVLSD